MTDFFRAKIKRISTYYNRNGEKRLSAIADVLNGLKAVTGTGEQYTFRTLDVCIRPKSEPSELLVFKNEDETGASLFLHLADAMFEELRATTTQEISVLFSAPDTPFPLVSSSGVSAFGDTEPIGYSFRTSVEDIEIEITEKRKVAPPESSRRLLFDVLPRFSVAKYSQAREVAQELLESIEKMAQVDVDIADKRDGYLIKMDGLFYFLRQAVPRPKHALPDDMDDFLEHLKQFDEETLGGKVKADELREAFDTFWPPRLASRCIASGKLTNSDDTGELRAEEVENAAWLYLGSGLVSPTLEHILIDSLLYIETVALARDVMEMQNKKYSIAILNAAVSVSGSVGTEVCYLLLTLLVSSVAGALFWAPFLIITGIRWLRPNESRPHVKTAKLVDDMAGTQFRTSSKHFNAGIVRERLYALERRGAAFSHYVYHLLDKRITREASAQTGSFVSH